MVKYLKNTKINRELLDKKITVFGFVEDFRIFRTKTFIDLRDESGIVQIISLSKKKFNKESLLKVIGRLQLRKEKNTLIEGGDLEILAEEIEVISDCKPIPFQIKNDDFASEELRLKYRYLDLRRRVRQEALRFRHKLFLKIRNFLDTKGFIEIETPILSKSTPEGARDFLVLTRQDKRFFALPQSPQIYKQLLMCSGFERYFQITKVFRDEDQRSDRQPEFTQLDIEMALVDEEAIFNLIEDMIGNVLSELNYKVQLPLRRLSYEEALRKYGVDKPDTRFDMFVEDISKFVQLNSQEDIGADRVLSLKLPKHITAEQISELKEIAKKNGCKKAFFLNLLEGIKIAKNDEELLKKNKINISEKLLNFLSKDDKGLIIMVGSLKKIRTAIGNVRFRLGTMLELVDPNLLNFLWIVDWPYYERDEENQLQAAHHAFTDITKESIEAFEKGDFKRVKARTYDLVLNGYELASGSIRQSSKKLQRMILKSLSLTDEEINEKFGHFLNSFDYGFMPSGGIAIGLDRIIMILRKERSIRDVIAFPKNANGYDPLLVSPSEVDKKTLEDYKIFKKDREEIKN